MLLFLNIPRRAHTYQRTRVLEVACDSAVAQISLHQISRKAERSKKGNEHVNVMLSAVVTEKRQVR